ncbi:MAG TPA: SUMF1/EgtB/PvdO family nonheme iron enzyme [Planctomycetaceae bacterium]|nr:SUMF1/EgtB/PvdO family nonheme iron enzyme [Planctomycetaceae bacterium]
MRKHNLSRVPAIIGGRSDGMRILFGAAVLALVAGCNNGSGNPAPRGAAPAAPVAQEESDPQPAPPTRRPAKPKVAKAENVPSPLDPGVNPLDVFSIAPAEPKFELVVVDGKPLSADAFTAILPAKGIDSTRFDPLDTAKPAARPSNRRAAPAKSPDQPTPVRKTADRKSSDRKKTGDHQTAGRKAGDHKAGDQKAADRKLAERKTDDSQRAEPTTSDDGTSLPPGFSAIPSSKESPLGRPLRIRYDRDGSEMALVTGGAVVVGHDGGPPESSPQLSVVLDSFYMDVNEVTVRQYERFRKALKEERGRNVVGEPKNVSSPPDFPALGVTLTQAQFYARWAGKQIPTEAEWERAARGEAAFDHPWGNGRTIWKHARTYDEIDPVKSFRTDVSPFGIYDLAGNAREWCVDNYSPTAFADAKASNGQLRNWKGPRIGQPENAHVVKGNGPNWDAWYRVGMNGSHSHANVGFRCVLRLPERDSAGK